MTDRTVGEIYDSMDEEQKLCFRVACYASAMGAEREYREKNKKKLVKDTVTINRSDYERLLAKASAFDVINVFKEAEECL